MKQIKFSVCFWQIYHLHIFDTCRIEIAINERGIRICERQSENRKYENRKYENSILSVSSQVEWQRAFNPYTAGSNPV